MRQAEIIKKIKSIVSKYPQVELAYLFGSFALGHQNKDSDVDVAVKLSDRLNEDRRFALRLELAGVLSRSLKKEVDVVVLNDIRDLFFKYVILKESRLVFRRQDLQQVLFETTVFGQYFDYLPFFNNYNRAYVKRNL